MTICTITRAGAVLAPLALIALSTPTAHAVPPDERGSYDISDTDTKQLCGRDWDVSIHEWGHFQVRATEDGAPEALVHDVHSYEKTYVAENGDTFLHSGKENFRIVKVERVEGDTWDIELVSAGRSWTISSASGKLIWADRGIFRTHVLLDTQGDDDWSNDVVDVSYDWSGPHFESGTEPGSQYCEYVDQAIAAG